MNNNAPTLHPSATEVWQYAQAITAISGLATRARGVLRQRRQQQARLAFTDAEHAARLHEARQLPAVRLMTDQERAAWQQRIPAGLTGQPHTERCTVWTAHLADDRGAPTGQWGLEAHTWDQGAPSQALLVVCRDPRDALALTRHLREHGTPQLLQQLHQLAATARTPHDTGPAGRTPVVLSEATWADALRRRLPTDIANRIIVDDPAHPHHTAWRELHQLANTEVLRVGADPDRLADLVASIPRWRGDVRNPPALAHWTLTEARRSPTYPRTVAPRTGSPKAAQHGTHRQDPNLAHLRAQHLNPDNPVHRLEAELGFGRHGSTVDTVLASKFPTVVDQATAAAARHRAAQTDHTPAADSTTVDAAVLAELVDEVERLDPDKAIDRRAAHLMLGRVPPQIDRLLVAKFSHDPRFAQRLQTIYPNGLPNAQPRSAAGTASSEPAPGNASARRQPNHTAPTDHAAAAHQAARPAPPSTQPARPRRA